MSIEVTDTVIKVGGTQVVKAQEAVVAAAAAATATNPAAPTAYSALTNLTNPVTKTEGEALSAALATLRGEVATYETAISAVIVDVADIRTQLNLLIVKLKNHGLIASA